MHTAYKVSKTCVLLLSPLADRPVKVSSVFKGCLPSLAIRGPRLANSILFKSLGLTNGIIEENDIPGELPKQKERKEEREANEDIESDQECVDGEEAKVSEFLHEFF